MNQSLNIPAGRFGGEDVAARNVASYVNALVKEKL